MPLEIPLFVLVSAVLQVAVVHFLRGWIRRLTWGLLAAVASGPLALVYLVATLCPSLNEQCDATVPAQIWLAILIPIWILALGASLNLVRNQRRIEPNRLPRLE